MSRSAAVEIHNKQHKTALSISITQCLIAEFGDITSVSGLLQDDLKKLNEQMAAILLNPLLSAVNTTNPAKIGSTGNIPTNSTPQRSEQDKKEAETRVSGRKLRRFCIVGFLILVAIVFISGRNKETGNLADNTVADINTVIDSTTLTPTPTDDENIITVNSEYDNEATERSDIQELVDIGDREKASEAYADYKEEYPDSSYLAKLGNDIVGLFLADADVAQQEGDYESARAILSQCISEFCDVEQSDIAVEEYTELQDYLTSIEPYNGEVLYDSIGSGDGELVVKADSDSALVKVVSIYDESAYKTFFVCGGESATISMPDGDYYIRYATGDTWYGEDSYFGKKTVFTEAEDTLEYETTYDSYYAYYSNIEITLYSVVGGNLETETIDQSAF